MRSIIFMLFLCVCAQAQGQEIYAFPQNFKRSAISSFENPNGEVNKGGQTNQTAKGNAFEDLKAGETKTLLRLSGGPGVIQRMWFTVDDRSRAMLRSLRLRIYWDNETKPAVDAPLGDFFGFGLAQITRLNSCFFTSPEARSFNCYIPMPFKTGATVTIANESEKDLELLFYDIDFKLLEKWPTNGMYFHAFWKRQEQARLGDDYEFLPPVNGKGRFLGVNMGVIADPQLKNTWWGEGEVKLYIDEDRNFPSFNGTGTEDYIGTGWGLGAYSHTYQGANYAVDSTMQYAFYRFHVPDEIFFKKAFRGTIQQIGGADRDLMRKYVKEGANVKPVTVKPAKGFVRLLDQPMDIFDPKFPEGWVNHYRVDDYSSTAYFYLDKPSSGLPALQPVALRIR